MTDDRLNQPPKTFDEVLAQSPRPRSAILLLVIAVGAMVVRFLTMPWDFGGFFLQLWISLVGTAGYTAALLFLKGALRTIASSFLFPLVTLLTVGTLFFAPQAMFPFLFFGGALGVALWFRSQSKSRYAAIAFLLLIPLGAYSIYGVSHIATLIRFRTLATDDVQAIEFVNAETEQTITVETTDARNRIVRSLATTTPYSPNHEGIREPWQLSIRLVHGSIMRCRVGKGNRAHPETAWISFGEAVYQNAELMRVLQHDAPGLWPAAANAINP